MHNATEPEFTRVKRVKSTHIPPACGFRDRRAKYLLRGRVKHMRRIAKKVLLPLLCVVALMASTVGTLAVSGVTPNVTQSDAILNKYDVDTWNGMRQVGKAGDGKVTAWDILKVDGYIEGVWIPWLTHSYLGSSLSSNVDLENNDNYTLSDGTNKEYWQVLNNVGIDNYSNIQLEMEIFNLKSLGFNVLAYAGAPWAEGRINDTNTWYTEGVKSDYLKNIRRFLDICRKVNMPVCWYMHFHSSALPDYTSLDAWYRVAQVQGDKDAADSYAKNFVEPVANVLAEYRDVVVMVGIADETYNEINDSNLGNGVIEDKYTEDSHFKQGSREQYGVTQEDSMYFHAQIGKAVKKIIPDMPLTCADNADYYAMYGDALLDMPGRNQYSSGSDPSTDPETAWATGPLLAGEYGMSGSAGQFTEDVWSSTMIEKRENYLADGYSGFFQWAYEPVFKTYEMTYQNAKTPYDLRKGCYVAYYWAMEQQGGSANAPSALYYCGTDVNFKYKTDKNTEKTYSHSGKGKVYWIKPENGAAVTVERSVNGGAWTTVTGTIEYDANGGSYRACMTDSSAPSSGTVQYRVTANGYTSYTNVWDYSVNY